MVSILGTARGFLTFLLIVPFSWFWGLKGVLLGFLVNEIIICVSSAILSNKICGKVEVNFNLELLKDLIRIGFPITIAMWVFVVQSSADRFISMSMLGKVATGYYALGIAIISTLTLIPQAVSQVLYPRVNEKLGETSCEQDLMGLIVAPARALTLLLPLMVGILILISPIIYLKILPQYGPGLTSAQILLLGSFFVCQIRGGTNFLIATNRQNVLIGYVLLSLAVNILGSIALVKLRFNIEGIAISTSFSVALLSSLIWKSVFKSMGFCKFDQFKEIFNLYLPFLVLLWFIGICILFSPNILTEYNMLSLWYVAIFIIFFLTVVYVISPLNKQAKEIYGLLKIKMQR